MIPNLKNFDPITFLNINISDLSQNDVNKLKDSLNGKIGEYVLLKLSTSLTENQFQQAVDSGDKIVETLRAFIPDIDQKVAQELENFKQDFKTMYYE